MEEEQSRFGCATGGSGTQKILHHHGNGKGSPFDSTLLPDLLHLESEKFAGLKRISCLFRSLLTFQANNVSTFLHVDHQPEARFLGGKTDGIL